MGGLVAADAADRDRVHHRHAVAGGHSALRRVRVEGGDPGRASGPAACTVPFVMLLVGAFLTAFYMFRVVFLAFFGTPARGRTRPRGARRGHDAHGARAARTTRRRSCPLPLWVLAADRRWPSASTSPCTTSKPEFESSGVADAGGRRRRGRRASLLAWLTYQRRAISADSLAGAVRADSDAPRSRSSGSTMRLLLVYRVGVLAFSRVVGWTDRYLVDGVLNVMSAWTVDGRRPAAAHADRPRAGLRVRRGASACWSLSVVAGRRCNDAACPILSDHHLGAVRRRRSSSWRSARHRPLLVRWAARRRQRASRSIGVAVDLPSPTTAARPASSSPSSFAAGAVARHLVRARAWTASSLVLVLLTAIIIFAGVVRVVDGQDARPGVLRAAAPARDGRVRRVRVARSVRASSCSTRSPCCRCTC